MGDEEGYEVDKEGGGGGWHHDVCRMEAEKNIEKETADLEGERERKCSNVCACMCAGV